MIKKLFRGRRNKNNCVVAIIGILICFVTVGFATLATALSISGSATIAKSVWDVHFTNIRILEGSVTPTTAATISNKTSVGFNVTLSQPNQYYKFLVDVENAGTIDAMIKQITLPTVSGNLEFSATYQYGGEIKVKDSLKAGETMTLLVILKYSDSAASSTTTQDVTLTINYGQDNGTGVEPNSWALVNGIETGLAAMNLINKANAASVTTYTGNKGELYTFNHDATVQDSESRIDYRYIGNVPSNYIIFNDELWRIIGVFPVADSTGKVQNRIKIMKDESIGNISGDYKGTNVGTSTASYGSNDWTDSQLMYFLNPDDIGTNANAKGYTYVSNLVKDTNGTVIYERGKLPYSVKNGATTYGGKENSWRVSADALKQAVSVKYYLGGNSAASGLNAESYYKFERGTAVNSGHQTSWIGKIALIYPSDYAYTFGKGVDDTCYNKAIGCYTDNGGTPSKSWMYNSSIEQWTLAPRSENPPRVFFIRSNGLLADGSVYGGGMLSENCLSEYRGVRPVLYLSSFIEISGTGTNADPYVIK